MSHSFAKVNALAMKGKRWSKCDREQNKGDQMSMEPLGPFLLPIVKAGIAGTHLSLILIYIYKLHQRQAQI